MAKSLAALLDVRPILEVQTWSRFVAPSSIALAFPSAKCAAVESLSSRTHTTQDIELKIWAAETVTEIAPRYRIAPPFFVVPYVASASYSRNTLVFIKAT